MGGFDVCDILLTVGASLQFRINGGHGGEVGKYDIIGDLWSRRVSVFIFNFPTLQARSSDSMFTVHWVPHTVISWHVASRSLGPRASS